MRFFFLFICACTVAAFSTAQSPDTWLRKNDIGFAGIAGPAERYSAVGFTINGKGYFGGGNNGKTDFWEYDPVSDTWSQKANFSGTGRNEATGFTIGNKGYVGTGYTTFPFAYYNDFWEFDPLANTWTRKADHPGTPRRAATGFAIGNKGYLGTGITATFAGGTSQLPCGKLAAAMSGVYSTMRMPPVRMTSPSGQG
jgi:N-acetylneuraminic acid mutarotase